MVKMQISISKKTPKQQNNGNTMAKLSTEDRLRIYEMITDEGLSVREVLTQFDTSERTVRRIIKMFEDEYGKTFDGEVLLENVKMGMRLQKSQDMNRIKNKSFREHARIQNAIEAYGKELVDVIGNHNLSSLTKKHDVVEEECVGIIHLSDLHFNEQIHLDTNVYNFRVASQRIRKMITKAMKYFESNNVTSVVFAFTGDIMNSDRRLDELLENANNRTKATFTAVDILQQAILEVNEKYNVTVASICGNEGRVNKDLGWIDQIASDNYDYTIHEILNYMFKGSEGVKFFPIENPLEKVLNVCGQHILMIHGHNGMSTNGNIESGVSKTISRYAMAGVKLNYVIMGHIHSANVGDFYSRSSGLTGANAYSEKALNLYSKASQNIYIVDKNSIDGIKIDLQETDENLFYNYDVTLESYHSKSEDKAQETINGGVTIFKIII